jgi:hypothetical protein
MPAPPTRRTITPTVERALSWQAGELAAENLTPSEQRRLDAVLAAYRNDRAQYEHEIGLWNREQANLGVAIAQRRLAIRKLHYDLHHQAIDMQ